ncbi:LmeA family phospholipid-binding protein [Streptomyces hypolithicus]
MRALRILLVMAVILGGIFVALDRFAVNYAEAEVAERVQARQGAQAGTTDVSIKGFPFLTQVAAKHLDQVDIIQKDLEASAEGRTIRIREMAAELHDVEVTGSLSAFSGATAERATGRATVSYADLTRVADEDVRLSYGGNGKVKVDGSVKILGRTISRDVLATVSVADGGTIRVRADEIPGEGIPGLEELVRQKTDFDRKIGGLPTGLKLEKAEATKSGLEISVTGTDVALAG